MSHLRIPPEHPSVPVRALLRTAGFLAVLGCARSGVAAQASPNLSPDDPTHEVLVRLRAHGLVARPLLSDRPLSRIQVARLVAEARRNLDEGEAGGPPGPSTAYLKATVRDLEAAYGAELARLRGSSGRSEVRPLDRVASEAVWADSPYREIPDIGLGGLDARINPLLDSREGRAYANGATLGVETTHRLRLGERLVFQVRPRLRWEQPRAGDEARTRVSVENLQMKLLVGNLELELGRDHLIWGPGPEGGGLASTNPRGFDMVKLSNETPLRLPWLLERLGPTRVVAALSRSEGDRDVPHALTVHARLSAAPASWLEAGASFLVQTGGDDRAGRSGRQDESNRMMGLDVRLRPETLRGAELYAEAVLDDFQRSRLRSVLDHNAGYIFGLGLGRLNASGTLSATLELEHTGITLYRHRRFTSGLTLDRRVVGNALGPDGKGVYVRLDWNPDPALAFSLRGAAEVRDSDLWTFTRDPEFHYVLVEKRPDERRYRGSLHWRRGGLSDPLRLEAEAAWESVHRYEFEEGRDRGGWLVRVGVGWTAR